MKNKSANYIGNGITIVCLSALFLLGSIQAQNQFELKYKPAVAENYSVSLTHKYQRETVLPDGDLTGNTIDDTHEGILTVKSVDSNGNLMMELELSKLHREKNNPGGQFLDDFPAMTGSQVEFFLSSAGEISGLEGFASLPEGDIFCRVSAPDHYLHRLETAFPVLPGRPVKAGDAWTHRLETNQSPRGLSGNVSTDYTYKLLGTSSLDGIQCLKIEASYEMSARASGDMQGQGIDMKYSGAGKEIIYFDHTRGMLLSKEGEISIEGRWNESDQTDTVKYILQLKRR